MEPPQQNKTELMELKAWVERIKTGDCVLVLGPRIAVRANDTGLRPLDECLASELCSLIGDTNRLQSDLSLLSTNLRQAADLYCRVKRDKDHVMLGLAVQDFYKQEAGSTTDFHRDLARLPFRLCISASPDSLMLTAFQEAKKSPQKGYYNFKVKQATHARLSTPTPDKPLVYFLFGHHEDPPSMVLTEGDLIKFIVSIASNNPTVPDEVRHILADRNTSFLFLGFGFQNWYLRVLLEVLDVYHNTQAIAFEDEQFFQHPEKEQTVGFFSDDRLAIEFRRLQWDLFAKQLREVYEASLPKSTEEHLQPQPPAADAPKAFLSYASEDRKEVEALAEELESRGIRIWQDKQNLRVGDQWNRVLFDVIAKRVDYVIVVQTPTMMARLEGVFNREIKAALTRQDEMGEFEGQPLRFLLPVRIGKCTCLSSLEDFHVIDLNEPDGIDSLAIAIREDWERRVSLKSHPKEVP